MEYPSGFVTHRNQCRTDVVRSTSPWQVAAESTVAREASDRSREASCRLVLAGPWPPSSALPRVGRSSRWRSTTWWGAGSTCCRPRPRRCSARRVSGRWRSQGSRCSPSCCALPRPRATLTSPGVPTCSRWRARASDRASWPRCTRGSGPRPPPSSPRPRSPCRWRSAAASSGSRPCRWWRGSSPKAKGARHAFVLFLISWS